MNIQNIDRIEALSALGEKMVNLDQEYFLEVFERATIENPWFTPEFIHVAMAGIRDAFLNKENLTKWIGQYEINQDAKKVGLILAGNIPAVGWNDVLCCFMAGHTALIKYSDKDKVLIPFLISELLSIAPQFAYQFETIEKLVDYDAVIATGSNNTSRYFEHYFSKKPHIIRANRNGVAILNGKESSEELRKFNLDVFTYFGLGCRNVAKIYVPEGYDFQPLLEIMHERNDLVLHNKYVNNFEYNIALYLLNKVDYMNNGSIILLKDERFASRIASLHYEYYTDLNILTQQLEIAKNKIQCIVSHEKLEGFETFDFGQAQSPTLMHYADGVDTMKFLSTI
jgi:hypothetical protein